MKRILTLLLVLFSFSASAQWVNMGNTLQRTSDGYTYRTNLGSPGFAYWYTKHQIDSITATLNPVTSGFTVLQQPSIGTVIAPGTSLDLVFKQLFAPPQNPFVTLSPNVNLQYTGSGTTTSSFTYGYGKNIGTSNILDAKINGSTSGITQSSSGASGSISETYTNNTNTSYTLIARTVDSPPLSASVTVTVNWYPYFYVGTCAGTTPTSAEVLAAATKGLSGGSAYNMNFTFTGTNLHVFYAYYNAYTTITSVKDAAGNQAIAAMTLNTVSLTDNGFFGTWKTVTTNNTYSNANIILTLQ